MLDQVTGLTVPNATLFLGELEFGTYSVSGKTIAQTVSDAAGRYSFDFIGTKGKDYSIIGKANGYNDTESITDFRIKEGEKNENFNIILKPKATIKIHVKKVDMSYDSLSFGCDLHINGTTQVVFGKQVDTNLVYSNQIAGKNIYLYTYVKKIIGQTMTPYSIDSIYKYLLPVDTTYLNLNY